MRARGLALAAFLLEAFCFGIMRLILDTTTSGGTIHPRVPISYNKEMNGARQIAFLRAESIDRYDILTMLEKTGEPV